MTTHTYKENYGTAIASLFITFAIAYILSFQVYAFLTYGFTPIDLIHTSNAWLPLAYKALFKGLVVSIVFAIVLVHFGQCTATNQHLTGRNIWGKSVSISWSSIQSIRKFYVPLIPFLIIKSSETKWPLWVCGAIIGSEHISKELKVSNA